MLLFWLPKLKEKKIKLEKTKKRTVGSGVRETTYRVKFYCKCFIGREKCLKESQNANQFTNQLIFGL